MNKEQLIQQLKYTKEKHKNDKLHTFDTDISVMCSDVLDVLSRCVEIPDNATNGDAVKTLFSNTLDNFCERTTWEWNRWWNAPYQKGGTNGND